MSKYTAGSVNVALTAPQVKLHIDEDGALHTIIEVDGELQEVEHVYSYASPYKANQSTSTIRYANTLISDALSGCAMYKPEPNERIMQGELNADLMDYMRAAVTCMAYVGSLKFKGDGE